MAFRMLGRVIEKWSTVSAVPVEAWGAPVPITDGKAAQRYFLRVAGLHPQTEETSRWAVACESVSQWERYPIGSWLFLQISQWRFLSNLLQKRARKPRLSRGGGMAHPRAGFLPLCTQRSVRHLRRAHAQDCVGVPWSVVPRGKRRTASWIRDTVRSAGTSGGADTPPRAGVSCPHRFGQRLRGRTEGGATSVLRASVGL